MTEALKLPRNFETREEWETFRARMRSELPNKIGLPTFPPLECSTVRARIKVGQQVICERVDVYVDEDYAIPSFVFSPRASAGRKDARPGLEPGLASNEMAKILPGFWRENGSPGVCSADS